MIMMKMIMIMIIIINTFCYEKNNPGYEVIMI